MSRQVRPVSVSLSLTPVVKTIAKQLRENDCTVEADWQSGTVDARDGDTLVFHALQKGKGQPWICAFYASDRINWRPSIPMGH